MNKWEEKRTRPVLPIYLAALVWPVGALLLPAYRLSNLLIIAGLSLAAYGLGNKLCPTRVIRKQVPYATGDVVDAALNLSVYASARGLQLSGRIIELHPAGFGNAAAEQSALVQALRRGTPLTDEQKTRIAPARSDIIAVYRELQTRRWHAEDLQPLFAKLGEEQTGKTLVALTALEQVGLIAPVEQNGAKFWQLVPTAGKKNLADAPILQCLEGM